MTNETEDPSEPSRATKRTTLLNDARVREQTGTFFSHTHDDLDLGGRFAKQTPQTVIGAEAVTNYPTGPNWTTADQGLEAPLGIDVNELAPCGEPHELKASAPTPEPLPFSTRGNLGGPAAAPSTKSPGLMSKRVGSPPFSKNKR